MKLDQDAMGDEIGLSREWVSKLETGKEKPSERVRLKVEKIEREQLHKREASLTHLKLGGLPRAVETGSRGNYEPVASRIPLDKRMPTRTDCEMLLQQVLDTAETEGAPENIPVIYHRLKKQFPLEEWNNLQ